MVWNRNGIEIHSPLNSAEILSPNKKAARFKQDSKIAYSINGSWYFKNTNVGGKWYIFRNICFVMFKWLSVVCCIDDCPILLLYIL